MNLMGRMFGRSTMKISLSGRNWCVASGYSRVLGRMSILAQPHPRAKTSYFTCIASGGLLAAQHLDATAGLPFKDPIIRCSRVRRMVGAALPDAVDVVSQPASLETSDLT